MKFDWFKRKAKNITTKTAEKKDTPKGLWHQTPTGKVIEYEKPITMYHQKMDSIFVSVVKNFSPFHLIMKFIPNLMKM